MWDRGEVASRLDFLRRADPGFARFGSTKHRYRLNPPLSESEVAGFEARHGVSLPEDYRAFILEVGDGGAGPFYGLYRLDRSELFEPNDYDLIPGLLAGEFPHAQAWNDYRGLGEEAQDEYFNPDHIQGSLNLSHQGCGYMVRLVLSGAQRGTLWEDGRPSDMGIKPFAANFGTWYRQWLDEP